MPIARQSDIRNPKPARLGGSKTAAPGGLELDDLWRPPANDIPDRRFKRQPHELLVENGQITADQLTAALRQQVEEPERSVVEILLRSGAIDEAAAVQSAAACAEMAFGHLRPGDVDVEVYKFLPAEYVRARRVVAIRREGDAVLVAVGDPEDIFLIDDVKRRLQAPVRLLAVPPGELMAVIDELSVCSGEQINEIIKGISEKTVEVVHEQPEDLTDLRKVASESPVIRYVNFLISSAIQQGASDIHVEPQKRLLRVRYRVDGVLYEQPAPPLNMQAAITSRLKIMANLDIAQRRLPQDGRIPVTVEGRQIDLRISFVPSTHGEKGVIRILDNRSILVGLDRLGMGEDTLEAFRRQIVQPYGILLVTGPTGSGKTTTLYSALRTMDSKTLNISTVEDPVEYELDNLTQIHVNPAINLTFAAALRSLLRQDPDVLLVGEIRDEETARIAVQASLTGHLVLSTLHTNDAPSSFTRLVDIGIEPYLVSAAVNGVLAQRLVRRICPKCKTPLETIRPAAQAYLRKHHVEVQRLYVGAGCENCRQTGYRGRVGLYEMLTVTDEFRSLAATNPPLGSLRQAAHELGMRSLYEDGIDKLVAGVTTVDEIMRVTET